MPKIEIGTTTAQVGNEEYKNVTGTDIGNNKRGMDIVAREFLMEVSKGNIPNHSLVTYFGHNASVGTTEETIWQNSNLYIWRTSATTMTVSSSSANDTSAGTGLRTVLISGLDANYDILQEIVTLNGQTGVTTAGSYIRVNQMVGLTAGSGGKNAGQVYIGTGAITAGKPASVVNMISLGTNLSQSGFFTIPAGYTAHAVQANYAGLSGKVLTLFAYQRAFGGLFLQTASFNLQDANITLLPLVPPSKFTEKMDVEFRGIIDNQTGDIKIAITILLVNENP